MILTSLFGFGKILLPGVREVKGDCFVVSIAWSGGSKESRD